MVGRLSRLLASAVLVAACFISSPLLTQSAAFDIAPPKGDEVAVSAEVVVYGATVGCPSLEAAPAPAPA